MRFECPSCKQPLLAQFGQSGKIAKCPFCGAKFTVPKISDLAAGKGPEAVALAGPRTMAPATGKPSLESASGSSWAAFGIGLVATVVFYVFLMPARGSYFADLFLARGWVPYAEALFMFWALAILALKYHRLRIERAALLVDVLPLSIDHRITTGNVDAFLDHLAKLPKKLGRSYMLTRIRRGLEHFKARSSNPEVASMMNMQSEIDAGSIAGSYTLVKVFLWAIPILGFVGTVLGISAAIAGFSAGTQGAEDMTKLMDSINAVTSGLGVAFDTTLVALVMSILLSFPASALQKAEEDLLGEVDAYCIENLLTRLSDAGGMADIAGSTGALARALAPALAETQADLVTQLKEVQQRMADAVREQAGLSEKLVGAIEAQKNVFENRMNALVGTMEREAATAMGDAAKRVAGTLDRLSEGIDGLNGVLKELDGKQVVIEKKRRGWFGS